MKRISAFLLSLIMLISAFPLSSFAYGNDFFNADAECYDGRNFYFVDENSVFSEDSSEKRTYYSYNAAEKIGVSGRYIYALRENTVSRLNIDFGTERKLITEKNKIVRFSKSGSVIYYLTDGKVRTFNLLSGRKSDFVSGKTVKNFWLEDADSLSYVTADNYTFTVRIPSGKLTGVTDNSAVRAEAETVYGAKAKMSLTKLRQKFPDGKYWNHGSGANNPNGYTSSPCSHHPNDSGCSYTGSCGCNSFNSAIQCMGYAYKCGYDVTGNMPNSGSGGWSKSTSSSSINSVKGGDIIRYRDNSHSIYVTGVVGDTVTYTDCNWGHQCKIRWEATVSKSTLKASFSYMYIAPFDAGIYEMELNPCGGECEKSRITVANDEPYGALPVPTREGYDFKGWFTSENGGTQITETSIVDLGEVSELYAHWAIKIYTVSYDANGGENAPDTQTKKHGDTLVINTKKPEKTGYSFKDWNTAADGSGTKYQSGTRYTANADAVLYAQWEAEQYRLSFNHNGGRGSSLGRNVTYDSPYGELPTSTKDGYDFLGWFTERDGGELITAETTVKTVGYHTLYAHWKETEYAVTFNGKGDGAWPDTQYKKYYSVLYISSVVPTMTGADFISWNTDSNGNGMKYMPGDRYDTNAPLDLYAQWDREKFTVEYRSDGGSNIPQPQIKEYGLTLTLSGSVPVKTGYTFRSWNTDSRGTGATYRPGGSYTLNEALTLYAMWNANKYKIRFDACDGAISFETKDVTFDEAYGELPEAQRAGYTFIGWFTEKDGGSEITADSMVEITSDSTFYARWELNTYQVSFVSEGVNVPAAQKKLHGIDLKLSSVIPEREGFEFIGWSDGTGSDKKYAPGSVISEDKPLTLYAVWKPAEYTVAYSADGAENIPGSQLKKHGEAAELSDMIPEKTGFDFAGWSDGNGKIYQPGDPFTENADTVLTALWTAKKFRLTFDGSGETEISYGEKYGGLPVPEKDNFRFAGWSDENGNTIYPDDKFLDTADKALTSMWIDSSELSENEIFYAVFVDGGETVKKVPYTAETIEIEAPAVPEKEGYTGKWAEFELSAGGIVIRCERAPEEYTAEFIADGKTVDIIAYTAQDKTIPEPGIPEKEGCCARWSEYTVGGNIEIEAVYVPIEYKAEFIADGKVIAEKAFTVESKSIDAPDVPEKAGYGGEWEAFEIAPRNLKIYALYSLETYSAIFKADGVEVGEVHYTIDTVTVNAPPVPLKNGYSGEWEEFEFVPGGTQVNAVYTPNNYTVTFAADGETVEEVGYTYGDESIEPPAVPEKAGYTAEWGEYTLGWENSTVNAIYTPIIYTAIFTADGVEIGRTEFTVETKKLKEPVVPFKEGYYESWAPYEIGAGDMVIEAVYNMVHRIDIKGFVYEKNFDYKTTITFNADAVGMTPECEIHWFINGIDSGTGESFTVRQAKEKYTVQAKIYRDGEVLAESRTEKVRIQDSFAQKIIAFFRMIFHTLPEINQI